MVIKSIVSITSPVGIVDRGGGVDENIGLDCFPLRIVGLVFETSVPQMFTIFSIRIYHTTILLEDELSVLFGVVFDLFWSLFY